MAIQLIYVQLTYPQHLIRSIIAVFLTLIKRRISIELLIVLENWLSSCNACVKWKEVWPNCFAVNVGVRQSSVLSPYLFNIYLDDVARLNDCYKRSFIIAC